MSEGVGGPHGGAHEGDARPRVAESHPASGM